MRTKIVPAVEFRMRTFIFALFVLFIAPALLFASIVEDSDPVNNNSLGSAQLILPGDFPATVESNYESGSPDYLEGNNDGTNDFFSFTGVAGNLSGVFSGYFSDLGFPEKFVVGFWADNGSGYELVDINPGAGELLVGAAGTTTVFNFSVNGLVSTSTYAIGVTMYTGTAGADDSGFTGSPSGPFEDTAYTLSLSGPTAPLTTPEPATILMFAGSGLALAFSVRRRSV